MNLNPAFFTCDKCGHQWLFGQHGGHDCAVLLTKALKFEQQNLAHLSKINGELRAELAAANATLAESIRQQARDIAALKDALADEVTANEAFRKAGGARDDEDMPTFCARLVAERDAYKHDALALMKINTGAIQALEQTEKERDQLRADLAAAVSRVEQAEARLATIDGAPTAASIGIDVLGKPRALYFPPPHRSAFAAKIDAVGGWTIKELIARPAKD